MSVWKSKPWNSKKKGDSMKSILAIALVLLSGCPATSYPWRNYQDVTVDASRTKELGNFREQHTTPDTAYFRLGCELR